MAPPVGGDLPPGSPSPDMQAFQALVSSYAKAPKIPPTQFVKKAAEIRKVIVYAPLARPLALRLADHGIIG